MTYATKFRNLQKINNLLGVGNFKQRPAKTGQSIIGMIAWEQMHYAGITLYTDAM